MVTDLKGNLLLQTLVWYSILSGTAETVTIEIVEYRAQHRLIVQSKNNHRRTVRDDLERFTPDQSPEGLPRDREHSTTHLPLDTGDAQQKTVSNTFWMLEFEPSQTADHAKWPSKNRIFRPEYRNFRIVCNLGKVASTWYAVWCKVYTAAIAIIEPGVEKPSPFSRGTGKQLQASCVMWQSWGSCKTEQMVKRLT